MYAVIPARNEAKRIASALRTVRLAGIKQIIVVVNGCHDNTREVVQNLKADDLTLLHFPEALGVDIPRAIGAAYAYRQGARHVLFYDGDLIGSHLIELQRMIETTHRFELDLCLTDPYGTAYLDENTRDLLLRLRRNLNQKLGLFPRIGLSNPSHGPHIVSRNLLRQLALKDLAKPPFVLLQAATNRLHIDAIAHIPHARLGSAHKGPTHGERVRETIIGDLIEALCHLEGRPISREYRGLQYDGYNPDRRFDILEAFVKDLNQGTVLGLHQNEQ